MREGRDAAQAGQGLLTSGDANSHGLHMELLATFTRMAVALESLAASQTMRKEKPTDAECYHYVRSLGDALPPVREIASALGWSHSHLLNRVAMPLTANYLRAKSGRFSRRKKSTIDDAEGEFDQ